jgi:hypothetical protein
MKNKEETFVRREDSNKTIPTHIKPKMAVFWVVASCNLVDVYVSEVLAASIIRAMIALMMEAEKTYDRTLMLDYTAL